MDVAVPAARSMTLIAGWVVVLTLVAMGAHEPPVIGTMLAQVPAGEPKPQSASVWQEPVQLPLAAQVAPRPEHWALVVQAPFWKTPIGPTGEAQVLVT